MATAEEVKSLSGEVNKLSQTIMVVAEGASKDHVHLKKFLQVQREELSSSIDAAAEKLDKSSKASFWLTLAIAFFACVEAGSIFYDVMLSKNDKTGTDCIAVAATLFGEHSYKDLSEHEQNIATYLNERSAVRDYTTAFVSCGKISGI